MTFKPGDAIWRGPYRVVGLIGAKLVLEGSTYDAAEQIPHSDALPAVARWLAELGPYAVQGLIAMEAFVDDTQPDVDTLMGGVRDGLEALRSLIVTLTAGEGAGGD